MCTEGRAPVERTLGRMATFTDGFIDGQKIRHTSRNGKTGGQEWGGGGWIDGETDLQTDGKTIGRQIDT